MALFQIEVPHQEEKVACATAIKVFNETGSHYLSNADWGCMDGVHSSWLTMEVDTKEDALRIVPPAYRAKARIVKLNKFDLSDAEAVLKDHDGVKP